MLLVDTSVWSQAFRRDRATELPEVDALKRALADGSGIVTTGLILQELLQGFSGPKAREDLLRHFDAIPMLSPGRGDHIAAAQFRNQCRQAGVQLSTIDALIAQIVVGHGLRLLTSDQDFFHAARILPLKLWRAG